MLALNLLLILLPHGGEPVVLEQAEPTVIRVGKLLTMNDADDIFAPGMLILRSGKIEYAGPPKSFPSTATVLDCPQSWASPGLVDLHTHVHGTGRDINDMVHAVNPELRSSPVLVPGNAAVRLGCASGVTTLFGIPGSGTNMGGFGVLYKAKTRRPTYSDAVLQDPGGLKVAQDSNPARRNQTDFGVSRAGMSWNLADVNDRAIAALEQDRFDPALEMLKRVHSGELPVLIHTAGSDGVLNTARMWRHTYPTRSTISHGSFDGWKSAQAVAALGMPVNHGPRTIDYHSSRNGRLNGSSAEYAKASGRNFSLNTDSPVVPQHEFFVQGAMSARYGGDSYSMLRAMTIQPATVFGIEGRVGSLEPGKDADVVILTGDPLDPRAAVELVLIDGSVEYDRESDGQWF